MFGMLLEFHDVTDMENPAMKLVKLYVTNVILMYTFFGYENNAENYNSIKTINNLILHVYRKIITAVTYISIEL